MRQPVKAGQFMQGTQVRPSLPQARGQGFVQPAFVWQSMSQSRPRDFTQQARKKGGAVAEPAWKIAMRAKGKDPDKKTQEPTTPPPVVQPVFDPELRQAGHIQHWNIARGFGMIKPIVGGDDIFVHIDDVAHEKSPDGVKATKDPDSWDLVYPHAGDFVSYAVKFNEDKQRNQAVDVEVFKGDHRGHHGEVDGELLVAPPGMLSGKVMFWNLKKGFGFIQPDDGSDQIFCHFSQLIGAERLWEGSKVSFNKQLDEKSNRMNAVDIRPE